MPVLKDELIKDLATPEYQKIVTEELTKQKFIIRDEAAEKTYLENYGKQYEETTIKPKIAEVHNRYEQDIKEVFPDFKKNANESTYDALKRHGKEKVTALNGQIATLQEEIKKGDPTGTLKKQLEEAQAQAQQTIAQVSKERDDYKTKYSTEQKGGHVRTVYADVKQSFKKDKPALFDKTEKMILDEAMANSGFADDGGKQVLAMIDPATGQPRRDHLFKIVTVDQYLRTEFKDVIDEKFKQGGSGSNPKPPEPDKSIDPKTITVDTFVAPDSVKDKDGLVTYMMSIGMVRGTPIFDQVYKKFSVNLPTFA